VWSVSRPAGLLSLPANKISLFIRQLLEKLSLFSFPHSIIINSSKQATDSHKEEMSKEKRTVLIK
jgi:hypothetical protein